MTNTQPYEEPPPKEPAKPRGIEPRGEVRVAELAEAILAGDRAALGRGITLIESQAPAHQAMARELLQSVLPHTGRAVRLGITGTPGVGKSTFIEALGSRLTGDGHKLAVLAIDPSSQRTGGSILGDKTRMSKLGSDARAFIRPSPSAGTLGGVARKTRETMLLCEAAGYDIVMIETVGVGQSETIVAQMVDCFLLLHLPGSGDELQGIKRGILELADVFAINKADGDMVTMAERAAKELALALHYTTPSRQDWQPPVLTCSARTGSGIAEVWEAIQTFLGDADASGARDRKRSEQQRQWMWALIEERLQSRFREHPQVQAMLGQLESAVREGAILPTAAAETLLRAFLDQP